MRVREGETARASWEHAFCRVVAREFSRKEGGPSEAQVHQLAATLEGGKREH